MIALRPLREGEYAMGAAHRAEYARGLISHVGMSPEAAEQKVERDVAGVLPDGLATLANGVARGLYASLGWAEESVHMRKRL